VGNVVDEPASAVVVQRALGNADNDAVDLSALGDSRPPVYFDQGKFLHERP
jgi:hypothetical protein